MNLAVGAQIIIRGEGYSVCEHPSVPGMVYGQEGRAGTVYQLQREDGSLWALKVFKPRFRKPGLMRQASLIAPFANMNGLKACERKVLSTSQDEDLVRSEPDLIYAVLMPWVGGSTWQDTLLTNSHWGARTILRMVKALVHLLVELEENEMAHGDLAAGNVIFSLSGEPQLIDLEGLYAPGLVRPETIAGGSPGYAHQTAPEGLWQAEADRFAGALLIAEILGWASPNISAACWGESYFSPDELQQDCERYRLLCDQLEQMWGNEVVRLFQRAWLSGSVEECPTFAEWLVALPTKILQVPEKLSVAEIQEVFPVNQEWQEAEELTEIVSKGDFHTTGAVKELIKAAQVKRQRGDKAGAEELYREALNLPGLTAGQKQELEMFLADLGDESAEGEFSAQADAGMIDEFSSDVGDEQPGTQSLRKVVVRYWKTGLVILVLLSILIGTTYVVSINKTKDPPLPASTLATNLPSLGTAMATAGEVTPSSIIEALSTQKVTEEPNLNVKNIPDFQLIHSLRAHENAVWGLTYSKDGKWLASSSKDGTINLIDTLSGEIKVSKLLNTKGIVDLNFSPSTSLLAAAGYDRNIYIVSIPEAQKIQTLIGNQAGVGAVQFMPDGKKLISASWDKSIRIWEVSTGTLLETIWAHPESINDLVLAPDGSQFVAVSDDGSASQWETSTLTRISDHMMYDGAAACAAFASDNTTVAIGTYNGSVFIWPLNTNNGHMKLEYHRDNVNGLSFSPDGSYLVSVSYDGDIVFWQVSNGAILRTISPGNGEALSIAVNSVGNQFAVGFSDGTIKIWGVSEP